jgi:hypothetical protein
MFLAVCFGLFLTMFALAAVVDAYRPERLSERGRFLLEGREPAPVRARKRQLLEMSRGRGRLPHGVSLA